MMRSERSQSETERKSWAEKQTYLAMNNLLIACAELRIDACPMEGFDNAGYDNILGLTEMGLHAAVIAPVGFRATDDETQHRIKVRKTTEELFEMA
ncbi:MAG: nitroreductase family protein [Cyclobacteriaceae bacterium]